MKVLDWGGLGSGLLNRYLGAGPGISLMIDLVRVDFATTQSLFRPAAYVSDCQARLCQPQVSRWTSPQAPGVIRPILKTSVQIVNGDIRKNMYLGFHCDVKSDQKLVLLDVGLFDK